MNWRNQVLKGDVLARLADLPDESVHCVVTSPPYWGLRDYGVDGQIGMEPTMGEFLGRMVGVFREVRRVLRRDGTCWLNMGDTYAGSWGAQSREHAGKHAPNVSAMSANQVKAAQRKSSRSGGIQAGSGLKPKNLCGIPWRLALALQDDGWWLRSDIIWAKPNPLPSSVVDRPGVAHEYIFLLTKSARYFYDADAVREPSRSMRPQHPRALSFGREVLEAERPGQTATQHRPNRKPRPSDCRGGNQGTGGIPKLTMKAIPLTGGHGAMGHNGNGHRYAAVTCNPSGRNMRSVWEIATARFPGAHFATFPPKLVERCIKAGCPHDGIVLDPFLGSGTTALVALTMSRDFVGIELNTEYAAMAKRRIAKKLEGLRLVRSMTEAC